MTTAATELITGRSGKMESFAQLRDVVVMTNGIDANAIYSIRKNTAYALGIAIPGAAPTGAGGVAGNPNGNLRYRVRWRDSLTGTMSLPSAELAITVVNVKVTITIPAGTPPARVTHWVIERTNADGDIFYPLNRVLGSPDGTVIGTTTYLDDTLDSDLEVRETIDERQGQPRPYRFCFRHRERVFMGGRVVVFGSADVTNGSTAVINGSGYSSVMVGWDFLVDGDSGRTYRIAAVGGATALTLAENYGGTTRTALAYQVTNGDQIGWSEPALPEHYGEVTIDGLSNQITLGVRGGLLVGGCGIGQQGVIFAGYEQLYLLSYDLNPDPVQGDGVVIELPTNRGALSSRCLFQMHGVVYGLDDKGIWRMSPGGLPEEIGQPLKFDFKRRGAARSLRQSVGDLWHIGYHPNEDLIYFFVSRGANTFPDCAFMWSHPRQAWVGMRDLKAVAMCSCTLPDNRIQRRLCWYNYNSNNASGAYPWMEQIGKASGPLSTCNLTGTVTSGIAGAGGTSLTDTAATFPTTDEKLKAVMVTKTNQASPPVSEMRMITTNTGTVLTVAQGWTANPVAGDTYYIGEIESFVELGRLDCGVANLKKDFKVAYIWMRLRANAIKPYVRVFKDDSLTNSSDHAVARSDDGITYTNALPDPAIDSTLAGYQCFQVPLNIQAHSLRFVLFSREPGVPWEVKLPIRIGYELEDAEEPRRK